MFWHPKDNPKDKNNAASLEGHEQADRPFQGDDVAIANDALQEGDLRHAAFHVGCALATDPTRPEWLALLDQIIARCAGDPLELAPLEPDEKTYFATGAVRAYILAGMGRIAEAVDLLLQVIEVKPDVPYITWLIWWKDRPGYAEALAPGRMVVATLHILDRYPEYADAPAMDRTMLRQVSELLALATATYPENEKLRFCRAIAVRKLGNMDEAIRVAREGYERVPGYMTALPLSNAYRKAGRLDDAIAASKTALRYQPDERGPRNDIADMLCQQGKIAEAVDWYKQVLERAPRDDWALPSYLYYMHQLEPGAGWDAQLKTLAEQQPQNARAHARVHSLTDAADS